VETIIEGMFALSAAGEPKTPGVPAKRRVRLAARVDLRIAISEV
jgi:hypothetical protein